MKFLYYIVKSDKMNEVSKEEHDAFDGEKYRLPSTWKTMIVTEMLLPLRYEV